MIKNFGRQYLVVLLLVTILFVHSLILSKLIFFPYPELFIYPYLTNQGLKPYLQILDQHFPGPMFLPLNLDNLGMNTPDTARGLSIVIVIAVHLLIFFIGKEIFKSNIKALAVNILYLVWQPFFEGWVFWIDSFLPLMLLPAYYFLFRKYYFWAGLFIGLAVVFKQILIPLAALGAIYILCQERNYKKPLVFITGLSIPIILMLIYFISIGVLKDFWYWTVIFNLTTYAQMGRGEGPTTAHLTRVLLVFGSAFLAVVRIRQRQVQIMLIFLIGALLGLSTRFDFVHFQPALPFALMAFIFVLGTVGSFKRVWIVCIYGAITLWWLIIFYKGHLGNRVISFDPSILNIAAKIKTYTHPGEKIFVYGEAPHLYQLSDTLPAGDIFVFQFPWFLKVAQGRILKGLIEDKPNIIVSNRSVIVEMRKITEFGGELDKYINNNYQKIDNVGTADILRRKS